MEMTWIARIQPNRELSNLVKQACETLTEDYYLKFFESLQGVGIFEPGDCVPVPIEIWRALAQVLADQSGYRIVLQAAILEPIDSEPSGYKTAGYREVYVADPTLFVQEAGE
jgi:hypothetical protein